MQYNKLSTKNDKPIFEYVVLIDSDFGVANDYYLFHYGEFEKAYDTLKKEAIKDTYSMSKICEVKLRHSDRTYYLQPIFKVYYGKVIYDKYQDALLHALWHIRAGEWLNPREDI